MSILLTHFLCLHQISDRKMRHAAMKSASYQDRKKNQRSVVKGTRFRFQMLFAVNEHHIPEFLLQESSFEL